MEQKRDLAIVLRSVPFEERHLIVTALTQNNGRISAVARNAVHSRRFGAALELFTAGEWLFTEHGSSELHRLDEAETKHPFEGLRKDFERLALASVFTEIMLRVSQSNQPCEQLFKLHSNALMALEETPDPTRLLLLLNIYIGKVLQWCGNQPDLTKCLKCGISLQDLIQKDKENPVQVHCITDMAGWVCPNCNTQRGNAVELTAIIDLCAGLGHPIRQILKELDRKDTEQQKAHQPLFTFLESLLAYHVPDFDRRQINGLKFLGLESNLQPAPENHR